MSAENASTNAFLVKIKSDYKILQRDYKKSIIDAKEFSVIIYFNDISGWYILGQQLMFLR